jgi:hypothetical protein
MKIELDERELEIMLDALDTRITSLIATLAVAGDPEIEDEINALGELQCDLFESLHRDNDGWDRENDAVPDAAAEFIQAGIDAREQVKAPRRAAVANDPIDW